MTIYLNRVPATPGNAKRIMEEQDQMMTEFYVFGRILIKENDSLIYISCTKADDSSKSTEVKKGGTFCWMHVTNKENKTQHFLTVARDVQPVALFN